METITTQQKYSTVSIPPEHINEHQPINETTTIGKCFHLKMVAQSIEFKKEYSYNFYHNQPSLAKGFFHIFLKTSFQYFRKKKLSVHLKLFLC